MKTLQSLLTDPRCIISAEDDLSDCSELKTIYHITHIDASISIINNSSIKKGLINDESKLNKTRLQVVWLSPNEWKDGYRYGTIRFSIDFLKVTRKNFYFVENMNEYNPRACRILISDKDHPELTLIDPQKRGSPIFHEEKRNKFYWKEDFYTLELMLEGNISFYNILGIDFVNHHYDYCSLRRINCIEKTNVEKISALFLSRLIITETSIVGYTISLIKKKCFVFTAFKHLLSDLSLNTPNGTVKAKDITSGALLEAILRFYGKGEIEKARHLSNLFETKEELKSTLSRLTQKVILKQLRMDKKIDPKQFVWNAYPWGCIPKGTKPMYIIFARKTPDKPYGEIYLKKLISIDPIDISFDIEKIGLQITPNIIYSIVVTKKNKDALEAIVIE